MNPVQSLLALLVGMGSCLELHGGRVCCVHAGLDANRARDADRTGNGRWRRAASQGRAIFVTFTVRGPT